MLGSTLVEAHFLPHAEMSCIMMNVLVPAHCTNKLDKTMKFNALHHDDLDFI